MTSYTKLDIIDRLEVASKDISSFYQQDFVNYRGKTVDSNEYYTEVVAEWCCNNIGLFTKVQKITRLKSYKIETHDGLHNNKLSNRKEELIAMEIFRQGKLGWLGDVIDYQTPLKNKRTDKAGKIDLLSYDGNVLYLLELKEPKSTETMLRCTLEAYTYLTTVDSVKLLTDFGLPKETKVVASPLVFYKGVQYDEMMGNKLWLNRLMQLMNVTPWYIDKINEKYILVED